MMVVRAHIPQINLGVCYYKKGKMSEAVGEFELSLKKNYNKPYAHYYLGKIYCELSEVNKAVENYKQAVKLKPDYTEASNELNALFEKNGSYNDGTSINQS
jgi:tetratricopeptide (TPR) repeat protein